MRGVAPGAAAILALLALTLQACASAPVVRPPEVGFTATAYCDHGITKSGIRTRQGIAAADPAHLPLGSVVRIVAAGDRRYEGVYTVMDTGGLVRGRRIDLFVPDCREAREFGVRRVRLEVVRLGWDPQAAPSR
jgi:3D (Asp-Asp-Asp) domain-containing protein